MEPRDPALIHVLEGPSNLPPLDMAGDENGGVRVLPACHRVPQPLALLQHHPVVHVGLVATGVAAADLERVEVFVHVGLHRLPVAGHDPRAGVLFAPAHRVGDVAVPLGEGVVVVGLPGQEPDPAGGFWLVWDIPGDLSV